MGPRRSGAKGRKAAQAIRYFYSKPSSNKHAIAGLDVKEEQEQMDTTFIRSE